MKRRISVLLVDDHGLVRRGFRRILEDDPEIAVTGEAGDGAEAVRLAGGLCPDVIVMDYALPGMSGVLATRRILEQLPKTRVLMLSMHSEATCVRHAFDAGARGYLLKNAMDLELVGAIKRVAAGGTVIDEHLAPPSAVGPKVHLTTRELEILQLIADGKSNKEIAVQLDLSVNTVAVHRANIMKHLETQKTAGWVASAIPTGRVPLPCPAVRCCWAQSLCCGRLPIPASGSWTSPRARASTSNTTAEPMEASCCRKRWAPAALSSTTTVTDGRTSCCGMAWTCRVSSAGVPPCNSNATTATALSRTCRVLPDWT